MSQPAAFHCVEASVPAGHPDAFEAWRWAVSPMFRCDPTEGADRYEADIWSASFDGTVLGFSRCSATLFDRTPAVIARAAVEDILVLVYRGAGYRLDANGRGRVVHPGDIAFLDMTRTMRIEAPAVDCATLVLPRRLITPLLAQPDDLHGCVLPAGGAPAGILTDHLHALRRHANSARAGEAPVLAQGTAALVAACFGASETGRARAAEDLAPLRLSRIRRHIDAHLADPSLGPEQLCRAFGLSRAALYRLFEPLGGVAAFIADRRILQLRHALAAPGDIRIGELARRWGYSGEAVFSRAFRRATGMSPREFRALARAGAGHHPGQALPAWDGIHRQASRA